MTDTQKPVEDLSKMSWRELHNLFLYSDAEACNQFDGAGSVARTNVEARVAFLEQEWVASQGIIGLLLSKLAAIEGDEHKA